MRPSDVFEDEKYEDPETGEVKVVKNLNWHSENGLEANIGQVFNEFN